MTRALEKGDRVVVTMRRRKLYWETEPFWRGQIVGESRNGNCWIVKRDLYKCPTAYNKSFVALELPSSNNGEG